MVVSPFIQNLGKLYGYVVPSDLQPRGGGGPDLTDITPSLREHCQQLCSANVRTVAVRGNACRSWDMLADCANCVSKGMRMRDGHQLRPYQEEALSLLRDSSDPSRLLSGNVRMPCGSGKTALALCVAMKAEAMTLVVTNSNMASANFAEQLQQIFTPPSRGVLVVDDTYTQRPGDLLRNRPGIVMCTYHTLTSDTATPFIRLLRALPYGLVILDEAQMSVADKFQRVFDIPACAIISFSATYYREDAKMDMLLNRVGPMLVNVSRQSIVAAGYIPDVQRVEVHVPRGRCASVVLQPHKMAVLMALIAQHARLGDKMITFCDELGDMDEICSTVQGATVHAAVRVELIGPLTMNTKHADRLAMLSAFRACAGPVVIFMSRVADTAINLPDANVLIQTSCHDKSRNRVVQRTGRIQRRSDGRHVAYEIVTQGSAEEANVVERRACMDEEGYSTSIVYPFAQGGGGQPAIATAEYWPYMAGRFP